MNAEDSCVLVIRTTNEYRRLIRTSSNASIKLSSEESSTVILAERLILKIPIPVIRQSGKNAPPKYRISSSISTNSTFFADFFLPFIGGSFSSFSTVAPSSDKSISPFADATPPSGDKKTKRGTSGTGTIASRSCLPASSESKKPICSCTLATLSASACSSSDSCGSIIG